VGRPRPRCRRAELIEAGDLGGAQLAVQLHQIGFPATGRRDLVGDPDQADQDLVEASAVPGGLAGLRLPLP
jgi:hypothetical protein